MFAGDEVVSLLADMRVTHVVWVPDSTLGRWEHALAAARSLRLVRVCREGEAWAVAAGLLVAGAQPLVMIQCTGLFESGDSLRNVLHDFALPVYSIIGYRSYLNQSTLPGDTCLRFTEPILKAWDLDYLFVQRPDERNRILEHYTACRSAGRAGVTLLAEGRA